MTRKKVDANQKKLVEIRKIMTKGEITKIAIGLLALRQVKAWRNNNATVTRGRQFLGLKGVPDIIGHHKHSGVLVGCEVKTVGDTIKPSQKIFLNELAVSGGIALIAKQDEKGAVILVPILKTGEIEIAEIFTSR